MSDLFCVIAVLVTACSVSARTPKQLPRTSWTPHAGAHARGVIFFTRPGPGSGAREGMVIAHQAVNAASFQPMNRTYVVSVEDLETLISEARHLASEEDAGTVHADLGGNLARTTGSGGEAT